MNRGSEPEGLNEERESEIAIIIVERI